MAHQYPPWNGKAQGQQPPAPPAPPQQSPPDNSPPYGTCTSNGTQQQQPPPLPAYAYGYGYNNNGYPPPPRPPPPPPPPSAYNYNQQYNAPPGYGGSAMHMTHHQQQQYPPQRMPPQQQVPPQQPQSRKRQRTADEKPVVAPALAKQQFTCETCSVTVDSEKAYDAHCSSHIQCSACDFEGAPKIVKAHHQTVHGKFSKGGFKTITVAVPGCKVQRFKICVGNRPEDIKKWIADRKKRFPRKQQSGTSRSTTESTTSTNNETKGQKVGLSSLLEGYGSSSEEDNDDEQAKKRANTKTTDDRNNRSTDTELTNASSINLDKEKQEIAELSPHPNFRTRICRFLARNGTCRNGDSCRFKHETPDPSVIAEQRKNNNPNNNNRNASQQRRKQPHKTLLHNLLSDDMQRERTLTLQLLKYITDNNFLDSRDATKTEIEGASS